MQEQKQTIVLHNNNTALSETQGDETSEVEMSLILRDTNVSIRQDPRILPCYVVCPDPTTTVPFWPPPSSPKRSRQ